VKKTRSDAEENLPDENGIEAWEEKALAVFGPIAHSGVYPDEPVNARSRARVDLSQ
jgi:hypothetical protein